VERGDRGRIARIGLLMGLGGGLWALITGLVEQPGPAALVFLAVLLTTAALVGGLSAGRRLEIARTGPPARNASPPRGAEDRYRPSGGLAVGFSARRSRQHHVHGVHATYAERLRLPGRTVSGTRLVPPRRSRRRSRCHPRVHR
jgi:hypothetical protein